MSIAYQWDMRMLSPDNDKHTYNNWKYTVIWRVQLYSSINEFANFIMASLYVAPPDHNLPPWLNFTDNILFQALILHS